ncbi:hypothetical protein [Mycobacterium angelicum]|uniref:Transmembrane protein n=1 Tax=Mycobacterium angelicum TaxID=470074 RepID=A0A1W9ZVS7_MYCAN|nr:hypothetical protein [Mycobacterium angelicum]MCV7198360.1 hypothetical protein [Mycobacterium angelicum]ORA21891.1 hypothetical protein BST12_10815 [Mycobacterium angelicum]
MTGPHSETEDTKQISVAELLARNGTIGAPAPTRRRRRRRGDSDAVTVAELTGEIPIIREQPHEEAEPAAPITPAVPANGQPDLIETAPEPEAAAPPEPEPVPDVATTAYWSEPEPRWPKSDPVARRPSGPERSEYPRPLRHTEAEQAGQESGAEHMSPDPVEHYGDASVDVMDTEVREADSAVEDSAYVRSYLQASEGTLFGGQSIADEVARRRGEQVPTLFDEDPVELEDQPARVSSGKLIALWHGTVIVFQSILAVVFGAGLFIAFDQLWRWNSIVALVLSVLVILGLVVGVRVVRKTEDIASTLIAVAVGALITLGPLALLQSG